MSTSPPPNRDKRNKAISNFGPLAGCLVLGVILVILAVKLHDRNAQVADLQKQLTQAKSDITKGATDLASAQAASTDLKAQLAKATSQQSDLQAQLDQSKQSSTELQAQIEKGKSQLVDAQAQLDKAKAQSADLDSQLHQSSSGSVQLLTQLDQAKIHSMDVESRLQKAEADIAQLQPLLLKARHMPITTSLESVHSGSSFTLHISNLYLEPLSVNLNITGPKKARSQSNIIGAGGTLAVEKLAAGENVVITSDGYDSVTVAPL